MLFDKAGVGLSDPIPKVRTLDDRAAEIEAVMNATGFRQAVIFGVSEGGPAAMVFAATRPERIRALILTGTLAYHGFAGWDDIERDPAELRARFLPELSEDYTPSTEQIARYQEFGRAARSAWGSFGTQSSAAAGAVDTPARNIAAHARQPVDGARDTRSGIPDRRAADPADGHCANLGHPCPRRHRAGAGWPVPGDHIPGARFAAQLCGLAKMLSTFPPSACTAVIPSTTASKSSSTTPPVV